jgi:aminopeptidase C
MNSSSMGSILPTKLREDGLALRALGNSATEEKSPPSLILAKAKMMSEIHCILTLMLGRLPSRTRNSLGNSTIKTTNIKTSA